MTSPHAVGYAMLIIVVLLMAIVTALASEEKRRYRRTQEIALISGQEAHSARQRHEAKAFSVEPRDTEVM